MRCDAMRRQPAACRSRNKMIQEPARIKRGEAVIVATQSVRHRWAGAARKSWRITRGRQGCLAALLALLAAQAFAQTGPPFWSAKRLVESSAANIELIQKGQRVDSVTRADVVRALEITDRIASSYGMAAPEVLVTRDRSPNAFVTYNNQKQPIMAVNTDMFRLTAGDENKLAAVIGHELGHLKANHLTDGRNAKIAIGLIGAILGAAVDANQARRGSNTGGLGAALGGIGGALVSAAYNRDQEREADQLGLDAMAKAGYNPQAVPQLWQAMGAAGAGRAGLWFDSHPSVPEREQTAAAVAQKLVPVYEVNARRYDEDRLRNALAMGEADPFPPSRHASLAPTPAEIEAGSAYARATQALADQHYAEAQALFKKASAADDDRATYMIGVMAARGDGAAADHGSALTLFKLAAESGLTPAIASLLWRRIQPVDATHSLNISAGVL
jgi:Zn-dependent protease with chaperone function